MVQVVQSKKRSESLVRVLEDTIREVEMIEL